MRCIQTRPVFGQRADYHRHVGHIRFLGHLARQSANSLRRIHEWHDFYRLWTLALTMGMDADAGVSFDGRVVTGMRAGGATRQLQPVRQRRRVHAVPRDVVHLVEQRVRAELVARLEEHVDVLCRVDALELCAVSLWQLMLCAASQHSGARRRIRRPGDTASEIGVLTLPAQHLALQHVERLARLDKRLGALSVTSSET